MYPINAASACRALSKLYATVVIEHCLRLEFSGVVLWSQAKYVYIDQFSHAVMFNCLIVFYADII